MTTYYGTWDPALGVLPEVTNIDFGAFYIIESGTLDTTTYEKDTWLLYICEHRGTPAEQSYWRVSKGVILINPDTHTNVPNSGWYTKVRLDNAGNIVAGADIALEDLPQELKEQLEQITDDNLNAKITHILSGIFKNNLLNPVQFGWDPQTEKIYAKLKLDEDTININEFGQLTVVGGAGSGGDATLTLQTLTEDVAQLKQDIAELKETVLKLKPLSGKGIDIEYSNGGSIINCTLDESSIVFNEFGELSINPNILQDYIQNPGQTTPSAHTHTSKDITDFVEAVNKLLQTNSANILSEQLKDIVDEVTIIINKQGKLEAIASGTAPHQHKMKDIVDLDPAKANTWASSQTLHKENANQDFNAGSVMMSTLTIGEILIAFNELFKEQKKAIEDVASQLGTLKPTEPPFIDEIDLVIDKSNFMDVIDVVTKQKTIACEQLNISSSDIVYMDGSKLSVYIDDALVETIDAFDKQGQPLLAGTYGNFTLTYVGDAYPKIKYFQGFFRGYTFTYNTKNLLEGPHTIYFETETLLGAKKKTQKVNFNIIELQTVQNSIEIVKDVDLNENISGVKYTKTIDIDIVIKSKNYKDHFAPIDKGYFSSSISDIEEVDAIDFSNGYTVYRQQSFTTSDFYGKLLFTFFTSRGNVNYSAVIATSSFINIDDNKWEKYRVHQIDGEVEPSDASIFNVEECDSSKQLLGNLINECVIKDGIAHVNRVNYEAVGIGPNYESKPLTQTLTLRFKCKESLPNFYFDLVDKEKQPFKVHKDGTLENVKIYAAISPTNAVYDWVNCNKPYKGYGHLEAGKMFSGLDLFRSTPKQRWVTFGKDAILHGTNLYIKFIFSGSINVPILVQSIEGCLSERQ